MFLSFCIIFIGIIIYYHAAAADCWCTGIIRAIVVLIFLVYFQPQQEQDENIIIIALLISAHCTQQKLFLKGSLVHTDIDSFLIPTFEQEMLINSTLYRNNLPVLLRAKTKP